MSLPYPAFINSLQTIAQNPLQEVGKFQLIKPTHQIKFSVNYLKLISGLAAGAIAVFVLTFNAAGYVLLPVAGLLLYQSIKTQSVETKEFKEQKVQIHQLFDLCIEGVLGERVAKFNVIKNTIHGKPKASKEEVKEAIEKVAAIYDGIQDASSYLDPLVGERNLDLNSYTALTKAAQKISNYDLKNFDNHASIAPLAIQKFKELCAACKLFLDGDKNESCFRDAYVGYGLWSNRAVICKMNK